MPELPEVEAMRCQMMESCLNSRIIEVIIHEIGNGPRNGQIDDMVIETPELMERSLVGNEITDIIRKGKYLWIKVITNDGKIPLYVLFHFGMTGSFVFKGQKPPVYQSFTISSEWPPKFTKILISFANGEEVAFCDPRRLGRITVMDESEMLATKDALACDCLTETISHDYLYSKFQKYSCPIKTILLDQHKVCSGIGNWVADEVLYHSRIHPATKCNQLSLVECSQLSSAIQLVITTACSVQADSSQFPPDWLFHHRWNKRSSESSKLDGYVIKYETINGRTSAYVPDLQKISNPASTVSSVRKQQLKRSQSEPDNQQRKKARRKQLESKSSTIS